MLEDERIMLSVFWIALSLTYLLGDVLRIFAGDFVAGEISGVKLTQTMWLSIAALMVLPIVMVILSLVAPYPLIRYLHIGVAIFFFLFNLIGVPTYPGWYDRFLIIVSLGINVLTVWYAWSWMQ